MVVAGGAYVSFRYCASIRTCTVLFFPMEHVPSRPPPKYPTFDLCSIHSLYYKKHTLSQKNQVFQLKLVLK